MTKQFLTLAAAAALTCAGMTFAADPSPAASPGGTSSTDIKSAESGMKSTVENAANDVKQAGNAALEETDLHEAINSANDPDKLFLVCAAIDNNCETQMADLAQQKAQDPQVKQIAQRILADHLQAQQQLKQAAQQAGVTLPKGVTGIDRQKLQVMQALSGKEFDQHYICMLEAGHAKAVREYQGVAQLAKNDQVKQYASKTLPTIQQHFQEVQQAATALGLPNTSEAQPAGARLQGGEIDSKSSPSTPGR